MGFEKTFRARYRLVCRLVRGFGVPASLVEDAAQEVFMVLYRRKDEFSADGEVPTSLIYGVARRVGANVRRKAQRRRDGVALDDARLVAVNSDVEERIEMRSRASVVRGVLDALDDGKRCVFVMVEVEGMSVKDFAADFDVNVNTAHARLRAARREIERAVVRVKRREASA